MRDRGRTFNLYYNDYIIIITNLSMIKYVAGLIT